jgi:KEOPS complex subunit Cgi121
LLKFAEEFQKYVLISGFREVKISDPERFLRFIAAEKGSGLEIQIFDAEGIATWQHLYFAVLDALVAFENSANISRSLMMEVMLYASAQRQIRKATEILGIKPASTKMAVVIVGQKAEELEPAVLMISNQTRAERDEEVLELTGEKMAHIQRIFEITSEELRAVMREDDVKKALVDLVIERMALLATGRSLRASSPS